MASPDPSHTYTGSKTAEVHTNLPARLVVSAAAAGPAGGDWTARVTQTSRSDGTQIMISLTGENVRVDRLRQDARNVQVARVTLRIVPSL